MDVYVFGAHRHSEISDLQTDKSAGVFLRLAGRAIFTFTDRLYHKFTKKAIGFDEFF